MQSRILRKRSPQKRRFQGLYRASVSGLSTVQHMQDRFGIRQRAYRYTGNSTDGRTARCAARKSRLCHGMRRSPERPTNLPVSLAARCGEAAYRERRGRNSKIRRACRSVRSVKYTLPGTSRSGQRRQLGSRDGRTARPGSSQRPRATRRERVMCSTQPSRTIQRRPRRSASTRAKYPNP